MNYTSNEAHSRNFDFPISCDLSGNYFVMVELSCYQLKFENIWWIDSGGGQLNRTSWQFVVVKSFLIGLMSEFYFLGIFWRLLDLLQSRLVTELISGEGFWELAV